MRPILLLIPITLGVVPAEAQYSPAQRAAIEGNALRRQAVLEAQQQFAESQAGIGRALDSRDRVRRAQRDLELRNTSAAEHTFVEVAAPETLTDRSERLDQILFAVTARGVTSRHFDPAGAAPRTVPQRTPGRLTFVSPDGAPDATVGTEVRLTNPEGIVVAELSGTPVADSFGVYRIDLPPLRLGEYTLSLTTVALDWPTDRRHVSVQKVVARE